MLGFGRVWGLGAAWTAAAIVVVGGGGFGAPGQAALLPASLAAPAAISVGCPFDSHDVHSANRNLIDAYALYGLAQLPPSLPDGATIRIEGRFPRARYFSFQSYDGVKPDNLVDSLPDARVWPLAGGSPDPNPAQLPDARGYSASYRLTVRYAAAPANAAERERNAIYVGPPDRSPTAVSKPLMYRVYLPNPGADSSGGTAIPRLVYSGPGGEIPFDRTPDAERCAQLASGSGLVKLGITPPLARRDIAFRAATPRLVPYANGDASYLYAQAARRHGPLVLIRSRRFAAPALPWLPEADRPDLRYWSACAYEPVSTAVVACLTDRDVIAQADGQVVIVASSASDRPPAATRRNRYNWLDAGDSRNRLLVLRQLLPRPGFAGAYAKAVEQPDRDPADTLGDWAPEATYCDAQTFAAVADSGADAVFAACRAGGGGLAPLLPGLLPGLGRD